MSKTKIIISYKLIIHRTPCFISIQYILSLALQSSLGPHKMILYVQQNSFENHTT